MPRWKLIKTAPRNTSVLMYGHLTPIEGQRDLYGGLERPLVAAGYYDSIDQAWCVAGSTWEGPFFKPTHWMPLPTPPKDETDA